MLGGIGMKRNRKEAEGLAVALNYLKSALDLLDASTAPGDIAAHVDLARHRLEDYLQGG